MSKDSSDSNDLSEAEWEFKAEKKGGAQKPGPLGGIYATEQNGQKVFALIKQDMRDEEVRHHRNMSEYVASKIFNALSPGNGAEIFLIKSNHLKQQQSKGSSSKASTGASIESQNDDDVYIGSKFFNNYKDLSQDIKDTLGKDLSEQEKAKMKAGNSDLEKAFLIKEYKNFASIMSASLLANDYSVHSGNVGVQGEDGLVRVDFGSAMKDIVKQEEVDPNQTIRGTRFFTRFMDKNYFKNDYPERLKVNEGFAEEIINQSKVDLSGVIRDAIKDCAKYYSKEALLSFNEHITGQPNPKELSNMNKDAIAEKISSGLADAMKKRQESFKNHATDIRMSLCFEKNSETKKWKFKADKEAFKENPKYFEELSKGQREIRFQKEDQAGSKSLSETAKESILQEYKKYKQQQQYQQNKLGPRPVSVAGQLRSARTSIDSSVSEINSPIKDNKSLVDASIIAQLSENASKTQRSNSSEQASKAYKETITRPRSNASNKFNIGV